jgi:hypothetical protein
MVVDSLAVTGGDDPSPARTRRDDVLQGRVMMTAATPRRRVP